MKNNTTENRIAYNKASAISKREILTAKREKFHTTCKNLDLSKVGSKAWSLLKNLNGDNKKTNPKPLQDRGDTIADDQKRAERHNNYFAAVNKANVLTEEYKQMLKRLKLSEKAPRANSKLFNEVYNHRVVQGLEKTTAKKISRPRYAT